MSSEVDYIAAKTFGFNGQKQMGFNPKGGFSEDEFYKSRRNFLCSYITDKVLEDTPGIILGNPDFAEAFGFPNDPTWYAITAWIRKTIDEEIPNTKDNIDVPSLIIAMRKRARWLEGKKIGADIFDEE